MDPKDWVEQKKRDAGIKSDNLIYVGDIDEVTENKEGKGKLFYDKECKKLMFDGNFQRN